MEFPDRSKLLFDKIHVLAVDEIVTAESETLVVRNGYLHTRRRRH